MNNIRIINTPNGGFVVRDDFEGDVIAALTNSGDLIRWISEQLGKTDVLKTGDKAKIIDKRTSDFGEIVTIKTPLDENGWVRYNKGKMEGSLPKECFEKIDQSPEPENPAHILDHPRYVKIIRGNSATPNLRVGEIGLLLSIGNGPDKFGVHFADGITVWVQKVVYSGGDAVTGPFTEPEDDGFITKEPEWIEWKASRNATPNVDSEATLEIETRNGNISKIVAKHAVFDWCDNATIVRYRVLS